MGISRGAGRKTVLTEFGKSDLKFRLPLALSICLLAVQAVFRLWEPKIGILIVVPIEGFVVGPGEKNHRALDWGKPDHVR